MTKSDKERYIGKEIGFYHIKGKITVEAVIRDINEFGILVKVTKSHDNEFYEVGCEYLIPVSAHFSYRFL